MPIPALHQDPFSPKLFSSPALNVTGEQVNYIRKVLEISCSDSRFAEKAFIAIGIILTGGSVKVPTVTSLTPNSAEIGDPSFTLHVHGTNFTAGSKIYFAGVEEPTTFVSATEVTTGVNMDVWLGPDALPVVVLSADGVQSNPMTFTFTDGSLVAVSAKSKLPHVEPIKPTSIEHKPTMTEHKPIEHKPIEQKSVEQKKEK